MFTTNFNKYACVGDTITCTMDKFTFIARVERDDYSHVNDSECYSESDIARWKSDEWFFCGIVLSCSYNGIPLACSESLWGIECNLLDNNDYLMEVANELLSQYDHESARKEMALKLA